MDAIQLVIFDLAGTTIEDSGQVTEAFTKALQDHGFQITPEKVNSVRGASKRDVIRSVILQESPVQQSEIDDRANEVFNSFRECLAGIYNQQGIREVRGALQTFEWLHKQRIRIALNTGFDRWLTDLILQNVGWNRDLVQVVVCVDDVAHGRPAPDLILLAMKLAGIANPDQVANVGDTVLDLQAGSNAGVRWNIGVLSGAHTEELLRQYSHTHLISSVAELPSLWGQVC